LARQLWSVVAAPANWGYKVVLLHTATEVVRFSTTTAHFQELGVTRRRLLVLPTAGMREWRTYAAQFAIVFAVYCIAGKLGQATSNIRSSNLGPVWPAYGIALGFILVYGYRIWPAILSAAFFIAYLSPEPAVTALGQSGASTLAAITGTYLLRGVAKFDNSIPRLRDAVALLLFGALASALISSSIGTLVLLASGEHPYSGLGSAWLIYWLGDSTGALLVTPVVLTLPTLLKIGTGARFAELCCLAVMLVALSSAVFADLPLMPVKMIAFAILPIVFLAGIRFGVGGAALSIFLVATVATVETALGSGSFASSTPFMDGIQLDAFFTLLSLTGLTFAALYSERERAEQERAQSLRQQVAMEVRLQSQEELRDSEERLRLAQQTARMGTFEWNIKTGVNTWNSELEALYGLPAGGFGKTQEAFEHLVHPEDRGRVKDLVIQALKTGNPTKGEWRVIWPDGSLHWIAGQWQVFMDPSGTPSKMVGVNMDIADRKRAEEARVEMTRKLIEAQEQERSRIGRELHDDVTQRLALLSLKMGELEGTPIEMLGNLSNLREEVSNISNDVQALSHELHSSKLEYLGFTGGIKSWCKEFADRHKVELTFQSDLSSDPSASVGISLFRVLQEAAANAVKHSGARWIEVRLWDDADAADIKLLVKDVGRGFDLSSALQGKGLGLVSMRERVRLLSGTICIESKPQQGTIILVSVPRGQLGAAEREIA
jgi:PAS domain S-box-containing protein